jgi:hypothetical protein
MLKKTEKLASFGDTKSFRFFIYQVKPARLRRFYFVSAFCKKLLITCTYSSVSSR